MNRVKDDPMPSLPKALGSLESIGHQDHSFTNEYRIFGPPGTGKTTSLTSQIHNAVNRYGEDSVLITSFSRAAAAELAAQNLPVSNDHIGTLHSICWNALGRPAIAEANVTQWNRENPNEQITQVNRTRRIDGDASDEDSSQDISKGDCLLGEVNRARSRLQPVESWPAGLRKFAFKWNTYKKAHGLLDFCDLIDIARRDIPIAPHRPDVICADEAQDLNPMQLDLVRQWSKRAQYFILAADDDQTIYTWCGATSDAVLCPEIPDDHRIILSQSHRLPRRIHGLADGLIHQVSRRQEKVYAPRDEDGECVRLERGGYRSPEYSILKAILKHLKKVQTVMLLASCSYMLKPLIAMLRKEGIPFHNPYRKSCDLWNPLQLGSQDSPRKRILSLLSEHPQTYRDLKRWAPWIRPGILKPGANALLEASEDSLVVGTELLDHLFEAAAVEKILSVENDPKLLVQWWSQSLRPEYHSCSKYPINIALNRGVAALKESPQVTVGTIHSVKGGQADVVFLFPDLSSAGDHAYRCQGTSRDGLIRLFYVGITRARHTLYLCQQETSSAVFI